MFVNPGEDKKVIIWGATRGTEPCSVTFTTVNGVDMTSTTARNESTFVEFTIPASFLTVENLPGPAKFYIGNELVAQTTLEVAVANSGGVVGPMGPTGPKGDTGDTGATGPAGPKGDKGDIGLQGPKGDTGPQGPKGDTGPSAYQGLTAKLNEGYRDTRFKTAGPLSTDFTSVNLDIPGNGALYNQVYAINTTVPANWPVEQVEGLQTVVSTFFLEGFNSAIPMPITYRFMTDSNRVCFYVGQGGSASPGLMIYVDGRPTQLTPYTTSATAAGFAEIVFPDAKDRLIEIRTVGALGSVYTTKPYQIWKPRPRTGPRVLVMGDSYVQGVYLTNLMNGIYHNIGPFIGTNDVWVDGIGGTGYGVGSNADGSGTNRYPDRLNVAVGTQTWDVGVINPDMVVIHGGGANDLYKGRTVTQIVADATSFFTSLRTKCPKARLVFVEGFAPPAFTPSTYNPNYVAIRQQVQAALTSVGVYYIDVATTSPWLTGTGRTTATTGDGNADLYVASDGVHLVDAGYLYIRGRMAQRLGRVLSDDGTLLNGLI